MRVVRAPRGYAVGPSGPTSMRVYTWTPRKSSPSVAWRNTSSIGSRIFSTWASPLDTELELLCLAGFKAIAEHLA